MKVNPEHGCCYIPYGGEEHAYTEYQVQQEDTSGMAVSLSQSQDDIAVFFSVSLRQLYFYILLLDMKTSPFPSQVLVIDKMRLKH